MSRILVDENILGAESLLAPLGEVVRFRGRSLRRTDLDGAQALLVRSVTKVNADLLAGTDVRFVGSATIGTDHLDIPWLESAGIAWSNAPGSNAPSVVDYCLSAFCVMPAVLEGLLRGERVGIIGYGNVGSRLHRRLEGLGISCIAYDPFLTPQQCPIKAPLDTVLACPVVSVHTPLTLDGPFPTSRMLTADQICQMAPKAVLLNAGRGEVLANATLKAVRAQRSDIRLALDVWEGEPAIDSALLSEAELATPHIAGYSQDGKWQGLLHIGRALAAQLGCALTEPEDNSVLAVAPSVDVSGVTDKADLIRRVTLAAYDVRRDHEALTAGLRNIEDLAKTFDQLRREYPARREVASVRTTGEEGLQPALRVTLAAMRKL
ncbi:4-phosphoerythronate dehydrogenase [Litorivivens sp.]|uniref:4-phosphoerythronate dehydrogenase n=1 Tax=Litorivivens sp. TaxID=2020868 RepID=UPI0035632A8A